MSGDTTDSRVRQAAFRFLEERVARQGEALPWAVLSDGLEVDGRRVPLIGPQGIFKPALCELPLSITTAAPVPGKTKPYDDELDERGFLRYRYRGTDPAHRDNAGLRRAMIERVPLIYLHGVRKGVYLAAWPVFIVGDDPTQLTFTVEVDAARLELRPSERAVPAVAEAQRSYATVLTLRRLHQESFRERVLHAYRESCAICHLKHPELLEAAHILPDGHPDGVPEVFNGLALCKLHHAAFDQNIIGVRPDLVIQVRPDVLEEHDGPMLLHGIQGFHDKPLTAPRGKSERPKESFLEERYSAFKKAG